MEENHPESHGNEIKIKKVNRTQVEGPPHPRVLILGLDAASYNQPIPSNIQEGIQKKRNKKLTK